MTVINTNVGALQARTYAVRADSNVTKAMERLSSGLRINSAADDAAGLAVANKMESQIRGMNMAIRNSQDGISLVQTAEAAMGEINNMVIRMRELAVQMNNGVYTDADRSNAQLEVTALLQEIDKVANNSAFNQVKILDGTYSQDIRAGNTNPEVINVTIDRMNTDSLGGGRVTTGDVNATNTSSTFKTSNTTIEATEGRVTFATANMGTAIQAHATANAGGTWSIATNSTDSSALFEINAASGSVTLNSSTPVAELDFDAVTAANNTYTFAVQYTQGGTTVTDNITLNVTDRATLTTDTTLTSSMQVEEGNCIKLYSVDTTDLGAAQSGIFSDAFQEFVAANGGPSGVTFAMGGGEDDASFTLNTANGSLQANLDFERPTDVGTGSSTANDNVYDISVTATAGGVTITENIALTILDDHNAQETANEDSAITGAEAAAATTPVIAASIALVADIDTGAAGVTLDMTTALDTAYGAGGDTPFADFVAANAGGAYTITNGDGTAVAAGISAPAGTLTLGAGTAAGTYDNLKLTYTATDGNTFNMFIDLTVTASAGGADTLAANGAATQAGEARTLAIQAGGEAFTLDLKRDSDDSAVTDAISVSYTHLTLPTT